MTDPKRLPGDSTSQQSQSQPNGRRLRITQILRELSQGDPNDTLKLDEVNRRLGNRAFGVVLLIFSLPNCLPLPGIPGLSFITGLPVIFFAAQLALGLRAPYVPRWLRDKNLKKGQLAKLAAISGRYLHWIERALKPRLIALVTGIPERLIGVVSLCLAVLLSLPVPMGNLLPGIALAVLALAIGGRDGVFAIFGYILSVAAVAWVMFLFWGGLEIFNRLWRMVAA
ncbi:exopolysaccharide biosynthesis protein [Dongia soli]|uniref:Exopolysaccharide biosynthesis protein n=1 Tax=Dongia soli TaxID=600628 RepID=A0ABU5E973_9PROT|nr:exopolysaccharide biosynthesis protein [Dongia soli]MDY0882701.1 exopolysaccharide biosynthesis protein [Dongia soli]